MMERILTYIGHEGRLLSEVVVQGNGVAIEMVGIGMGMAM